MHKLEHEAFPVAVLSFLSEFATNMVNFLIVDGCRESVECTLVTNLCGTSDVQVLKNTSFIWGICLEAPHGWTILGPCNA